MLRQAGTGKSDWQNYLKLEPVGKKNGWQSAPSSSFWQLTLFQPLGKQIMPATFLLSPLPPTDFQTFLRPCFIKVSKFQKQIFLFSFEPKTERNYFLNSALASKMSQMKKNEGTLLY